MVSFLMSSVVKLRVINALGSVIFAAYALVIHSYPTAFMNFCLVGINLYYLMRLKKPERQYKLIEEKPGSAFLEYYLKKMGFVRKKDIYVKQLEEDGRHR